MLRVIRVLERPIVHRYKEIEAFPQVLNNSQMWNFHSRMWLTEAKQNLTKEEEGGLPSKWTSEELASLEKTLKEHEVWLDMWVEKQKSVKRNQDPVIETKEMTARAKVLENALAKLARRRIAKHVRKTSTSAAPEPTESTPPPPPPPAEEPVEHDHDHEDHGEEDHDHEDDDHGHEEEHRQAPPSRPTDEL